MPLGATIVDLLAFENIGLGGFIVSYTEPVSGAKSVCGP
jgi:hypothetical protein